MLNISGVGRIIFAVLSGLLLMLIFPAFNFSFLAWIWLIPLLMAIDRTSLTNSFFLGFSSGAVAYVGILYWIGETLIRYGQLPTATAYLILVMLAFYMALYIGVFCLFMNFFSLHNSSTISYVFFGSCLWVFLELCRTYFFSGFPWALLGYSQWKNIPLIQISAFTGCYGVSFLIIMINLSIKKLIDIKFEKENLKINCKVFIFAVSILMVSCIYGYFISRGEKGKKPFVKVVILQGNVSQLIKWDVTYKERIMNKYETLIKKTEHLNPQVIVWPETALPDYVKYEEGLNNRLEKIILESNAYHIIGGPDIFYKTNLEKEQYYNSAFLFSPQGKIVDQYNKIHLVPFGEMVPMRILFSKVIRVLNEIGDFNSGEKIKILRTPYTDFGVTICFEAIFPNLVRKFVKSGAEIMVNITNDAWFGKTAAPYQHFAASVFRAVENRVNVIRVANTGISGFIDMHGRVKKSSPLFVEDYLEDNVFLSLGGKTFYTKYGNIFAYICSFMTLILMLIIKKDQKHCHSEG